MSNSYVQLRRWRRSIRDADDAVASQKAWYACYTRARHEKRVDRVLGDRGIERYLPLVGQERQWHDRTKTVHFPLFPGYVFVRISSSEVFDVTCVASVVSLVMADGRPAQVTDDEIENIRRYADALTQAGETPEPHQLVERGQKLVVLEGPFAGVEGTVVDVRGQKRILVGIAALGQGFVLNVSLEHLRLFPR